MKLSWVSLTWCHSVTLMSLGSGETDIILLQEQQWSVLCRYCCDSFLDTASLSGVWWHSGPRLVTHTAHWQLVPNPAENSRVLTDCQWSPGSAGPSPSQSVTVGPSRAVSQLSRHRSNTPHHSHREQQSEREKICRPRPRTRS